MKKYSITVPCETGVGHSETDWTSRLSAETHAVNFSRIMRMSNKAYVETITEIASPRLFAFQCSEPVIGTCSSGRFPSATGIQGG